MAGGRLWAPPSTVLVRMPRPGAWRSFSESDVNDPEQLRRIAARFGPLTAAGTRRPGELLLFWQWLVKDLRVLADTWHPDGRIKGDVERAAGAIAARQQAEQVLLDHQAAGGRFAVAGDGAWALACRNLEDWWRIAAIQDVQRQHPEMRRCRHCGLWMSLQGMRRDASFCCTAHRSAYYQKRKPAFWTDGDQDRLGLINRAPRPDQPARPDQPPGLINSTDRPDQPTGLIKRPA
jgi:hypothetical protein